MTGSSQKNKFKVVEIIEVDSYVDFSMEGRKKMKYQYKEMPESMKGTYGEFAKNFGFDWKEFIMGINRTNSILLICLNLVPIPPSLRTIR